MDMTESLTTHERIVLAATVCFRRWGVEKTSMGDIAAEAKLRRPQLYRHVESKEALIVTTIVHAAEELSRRRLAALPIDGPATDLIVESLVMGHDDLLADAFAAHLIGDGARTFLRLLDEDSGLREAQQLWWLPVITYGQDGGELRQDLSVDEITDWFLMSQIAMVEHAERYPTRDSVRRHLTNFIVPAVAAHDIPPTRK
jgi:AcrR family transcriptional regulator